MPSYKRAIEWIVLNDDIEDVDVVNKRITPAMALVADMFDKSDDKVITDTLKAKAKQETN